MPELSIIIVNYNTFNYTKECIESIFRYPPKVSFEIILVDNGSKDENPDKFLDLFPDIKLIKSTENLGFAKGNNLGIVHSIGDYLLLLNSDTELIMEGLEMCIKTLKDNSEIGVLSCRIEYPDGKVQHVANRFPSLKNEIIELFRLQKLNRSGKWLLGSFFDHQSQSEADWVWGTFFLVKKDVLKNFKNKILPAPYYMYFEDVLWCYNIRSFGYKVFYYPEYKIIHHLSKSSGFDTDNWKKIAVIAENENQFLKQEKSFFYIKMLYLLRAIKFFSISIPNSSSLAKFCLKLTFKR